MATTLKAHLGEAQSLEALVKPEAKSAFKAAKTGFEGHEAELGRSIQTVLKTFANSAGYQHEINDALIKSRLQAMQFCKDQGLIKEYVAHDRKTMLPINSRVRQIIEKTGDKEAALVGMCERTACHYHLVLETQVEPGKRTWKSPWKRVLDACKRMNMFDLDEKWIHENWLTPRLKGYAEDLGVKIRVSEWNDDGIVTLELAE